MRYRTRKVGIVGASLLMVLVLLVIAAPIASAAT